MSKELPKYYKEIAISLDIMEEETDIMTLIKEKNINKILLKTKSTQIGDYIFYRVRIEAKSVYFCLEKCLNENTIIEIIKKRKYQNKEFIFLSSFTCLEPFR